MTIDKLNILEMLVEELLKESPEEKVVRTCMNEAGIPDTKDPIDRINKVLHALEFAQADKELN